MKFSPLVPIAACSMLIAGSSHAQSLYSLVPTFDGEDGSSPLQWTVGASLGYDDNVNNGDGQFRAEQDSAFARAFIQATYANVDARTQWSISARLGFIYLFNDQTVTGGVGLGANSVNNQLNSDSALNYRLTHRISDRLRFSSRGGVSYQLEPNLQNGLAANRQIGEFFSWNIDNSIGYEVNPRFGLVLGYTFGGITYTEFDIEDRLNHTFYTQLRYRMSDRTVLTGGYRYLISDNGRGVGNVRNIFDSTSHIITAGIEHRFSPVSVMTLNLGTQIRESDNSRLDRTTPFAELGLRTQLSPQFSARVFSRLMQEDGELASPFGGGQFGSRLVWRTGVQTTYVVTPQLSFNGGLTWINSAWQDGLAAGSLVDELDEDVINLSLGFAYQFYQNLSLTGSYNYTTSTSDNNLREFDRNRFMLGVQTSF